MAKITRVRLFLSMANVRHLLLYLLDIKNIFLHSDLEEGAYMDQSFGFVARGKSNSK